MPDIITDGKTKVSFVPTITNIAAPTAAQLNAGQSLESLITSDGLGTELSADAVDTTSLASTFGSELPGRTGFSGELTFKDQGRDQVPWSTFAGKPDGFLVIRRGVDVTTAWAASQKVEVYPVNIGIRRPIAPAANEVAKFAVGVYMTGTPNVDATVA